jgi:hypothetical protein
MLSWGVDPARVLEDTGKTVDTTDIHRAALSIEMYSNRSEALSGDMAPRDLVCIQRAVCWQVAWLTSQVGYYSRSLAVERKQDGIEIDHGSQGDSWREWADTLSPLAARQLKNLSWLGTRVERTRPAGRRRAPNFLTEDGTW